MGKKTEPTEKSSNLFGALAAPKLTKRKMGPNRGKQISKRTSQGKLSIASKLTKRKMEPNRGKQISKKTSQGKSSIASFFTSKDSSNLFVSASPEVVKPKIVQHLKKTQVSTKLFEPLQGKSLITSFFELKPSTSTTAQADESDK